MSIDGRCPCKGCTPATGRSETCHCTCDKYRIWKEINGADGDLRRSSESPEINQYEMEQKHRRWRAKVLKAKRKGVHRL